MSSSALLHHPMARLASLLVGRQAQPFEWGLRDCALFAADAVAAMTQHDPAAGIRGTYRSAIGAQRVLRRLGGLHGALRSRFCAVEIPAGTAADGDLALLRVDAARSEMVGHGALGVVWRGAVVAQGAAGLVLVPMAAARGIWRAQP